MITKSRNAIKRQNGFTLVEIMVGLAIGMLATLIIIQVISVFEAQTRTTTGTADAQTNGSIALYNVTRDIQMAGYSLMPGVSADNAAVLVSPLNCSTATMTFGTTGMTSIVPIGLANGVSDTITIRYGNSAGGGIPTKVNGVPAAAAVPVESSLGCSDWGDIVLFVNGTQCGTARLPVSGVTDATTIALADPLPVAAVEGANVSCLGAWHEVTYRVNNNNLERRDTAESPNFLPTIAGIVNIQAQYGTSAATNDNQVTLWVEPDTIDLANPAQRNRIKAIRIAIVARNEKTESGSDVTTAISAWTGSASSPAPAVDLSADANWKRYRYRVFETIVPVRNIIWSKDTL